MSRKSDQRNGGPECYADMKIGVIPRDKVDPAYLAKLTKEYNSLSAKQKQSFWRTHSISAT